MLFKILHEELQHTRHSMILMGQDSSGLVNGLDKMVETVRLELPDKDELIEQLSKIADDESAKLTEDDAIKSADALAGLTEEQARLNIRRVLVLRGRADPDLLIKAKALTFKEQGILDLMGSDLTLDDVGGCDIAREWLLKRMKAFSPEGKRFIGRTPKGAIFIGPPGTGKTLISMAIAGSAKLPLLRLDMGKIFGSLVGESEQRMREALDMAERAAPCVLQVDEMEKGMAQGDGDGGTTRRVFGKFVTWLQEKTAPVLVIGTMNSMKGVPPEMFRKGRFDEIFYVDLPQPDERETILRIHIDRRFKQECGILPATEYDLQALIGDLTHDFSGSELEELVVSSLFDALDDGVDHVTQEHLVNAAKVTVPLAKTRKEDIDAMREWARTRARFASSAAAKRLMGGEKQSKVVALPPALAGVVRLDDEELN